MPEHEPHVGQPNASSSARLASSILPADTRHPLEHRHQIDHSAVRVTPAFIGPR